MSACWSAFLLFAFIGTQPLAMATATPEERLAGSPLDRLLVPMMTAMGFALIWARKEAALEALRANKLLVAVVLFCQASILWSNYPDLTLRRALLLLFVTAISLGLAASIDDLRRFHARLFQTLVFVILVNLAATALWPDLAITDIGVAGIYGQKNPAGMVAMIVTIVCVTYGFGATRAIERALAALGAALSLFFLLITLSKTSIGLTFLALAVGGLFWLVQRLGFRFALVALAGLAALRGGIRRPRRRQRFRSPARSRRFRRRHLVHGARRIMGLCLALGAGAPVARPRLRRVLGRRRRQ